MAVHRGLQDRRARPVPQAQTVTAMRGTPSGGDVNVNTTPKSVIQLQLPAGHYLLSASLVANNPAGTTNDFTCRLYVNYDGSLTNSIDDDPMLATTSSLQFSLQGTVTYTQPGYAVVECDASHASFVTNTHLSAVAVDNLH